MSAALIVPPVTWFQRLALMQGIVAPVLFAAIAIVGGLYHPGYSHLAQAISELTAAGAVNKPTLDIALLLMEGLTLVFGLAYAQAVRQGGWQLRASAWLIVLIAVIGFGFARYPMDQIGTPMTPDGWMHLVIVSASAISAIASVVLAALGWGRLGWRGDMLRRLCWTVVLIMLASGGISALVGVNGWPGIGIWQRVNTGAFSLFQIATVLVLLRWRAA